nr:hypothetical protein [Leucobacter coleopterorum]
MTEEVTDVDLVQAQMKIAAGATLEELGLLQDQIQLRGAALQCRITTEDPANGFRPDLGRITAYRSPVAAECALTAVRLMPVRRSARTSTRCSQNSHAVAEIFNPR